MAWGSNPDIRYETCYLYKLLDACYSATIKSQRCISFKATPKSGWHDEAPKEERMWLDYVHGGVEEKSSNRRLPSQELTSGRGFRVGMRTVSKVFGVEVSGTCIFHEVGEEEKRRVPGFQLSI